MPSYGMRSALADEISWFSLGWVGLGSGWHTVLVTVPVTVSKASLWSSLQCLQNSSMARVTRDFASPFGNESHSENRAVAMLPLAILFQRRKLGTKTTPSKRFAKPFAEDRKTVV